MTVLFHTKHILFHIQNTLKLTIKLLVDVVVFLENIPMVGEVH